MSLEDQIVNQKSDTSIQGFLSLLSITLLLSLFSLLLFEFLRSKRSLLNVFSPRCIQHGEHPPPLSHPSPRFLSWVKHSLNVRDAFFVSYCGYDAMVYIRFLRMCFYVTFLGGLLIPPILVPVNVAGGGKASGLLVLSMANVMDGSGELWVHFGLTLGLVVVIWGFLYYHYAEYTLLRQQYLKVERGVHHRTVFVEGLPATVRDDETLKKQFEALKLGEVVRARVNPEYGELSRLKGGDTLAYKVYERNQLFALLEREVIRAARTGLKKGKHQLAHPAELDDNPQELKEVVQLPQVKDEPIKDISQVAVEGSFWNYFFHYRSSIESLIYTTTKKSNWFARFQSHHLKRITESIQTLYSSSDSVQGTAIDKLAARLVKLDAEIQDLRCTQRYSPSSTGFVTFRSPHSAHLLSQVLIHPAPFMYETSMAPEPRDIVWENMSLSRFDRTVRHYLVEAACVALTFFWIAPMSLIAGLATVDSLERMFPGFKTWGNNEVVLSFVQSVLPNLLIIGFFFVIPYIFQCM
jgi:hypothetical protein